MIQEAWAVKSKRQRSLQKISSIITGHSLSRSTSCHHLTTPTHVSKICFLVVFRVASHADVLSDTRDEPLRTSAWGYLSCRLMRHVSTKFFQCCDDSTRAPAQSVRVPDVALSVEIYLQICAGVNVKYTFYKLICGILDWLWSSSLFQNWNFQRFWRTLSSPFTVPLHNKRRTKNLIKPIKIPFLR